MSISTIPIETNKTNHIAFIKELNGKKSKLVVLVRAQRKNLPPNPWKCFERQTTKQDMMARRDEVLKIANDNYKEKFTEIVFR